MKHLVALLLVRPLLWIIDLVIALAMAPAGSVRVRFAEERRRSRSAWCVYRLSRGES